LRINAPSRTTFVEGWIAAGKETLTTDGAELFKQQPVDIGTEEVTDHQAEVRERVGCGI
jgi:hypothetical protein